MKLKDVIKESREFVIIDPRGNARPVGAKSQGAQYVKKMGGPAKGYHMVLAKNAMKARRAIEKNGGNATNSKIQNIMFDLMYEGDKKKGDKEVLLGESTAKDTLKNAVVALTKTIGGKKIDKNYVKDYLKSIEQMARKKPMDFVKDYGEFDVSDWLEDVRYNMANEGKLTEGSAQDKIYKLVKNMRGNAYKNLAHEYLHGSEDPSDMENFIFDLSNTEAKELEKEIKSKMFESKLTEGRLQDEVEEWVRELDKNGYSRFADDYKVDPNDATEMMNFVMGLSNSQAKKILKDLDKGLYEDTIKISKIIGKK